MPDPAAQAQPEAEEVVQTAPPKTADDGNPLDGKWPHNHRLRAEALARAGKEKDPDGLIAPDLIADTAQRIADEDAFEAAEADRIKAEEARAAEAAKRAAGKAASKGGEDKGGDAGKTKEA